MNAILIQLFLLSIILTSCSSPSKVDLKSNNLYGEWECTHIEYVENGKIEIDSIHENKKILYYFDKFDFAYLFKRKVNQFIICDSFTEKLKRKELYDSIYPYAATHLLWNLYSDTLVIHPIMEQEHPDSFIISSFNHNELKLIKLNNIHSEVKTYYAYKRKTDHLFEWEPKSIDSTIKVNPNLVPKTKEVGASISYNFDVPKFHYARAYLKDSLIHIIISDLSYFNSRFIHMALNQKTQKFNIELDMLEEGYVFYKGWNPFFIYDLSVHDSLYKVGDYISGSFDCQIMLEQMWCRAKDISFVPSDSIPYRPLFIREYYAGEKTVFMNTPLRYSGRFKLPLLAFEDERVKERKACWYDEWYIGSLVKVDTLPKKSG